MMMKIQQFTATFLILISGSSAAFAQTTAFNYQGRLTDSDNAANGTFQMQFKLFDAASGGEQIGSTVSDPAVAVTNGIFSLKLDSGAGGDRPLPGSFVAP